jgi:hypothetical protein
MIAIIISIILLAIVVWLHLYTEPFQNQKGSPTQSQALPTINPELVKNYHDFVVGFYNPFMSTWKRAITTAISTTIVQQPLTSPDQISTSTSPPPPTQTEMNEYIANLSQQKGKLFPPVTTPFPDSIDLQSFPDIARNLPADPAPYHNALEWMNKSLTDAHEQLQSALKGEGFMDLEGFDGQTCQDLSKCFQEHPEWITNALQQSQTKQQSQINDQIKLFLNDKKLNDRFIEHAKLIEKSKKVQDQAQSGELINQLNMPDEPSNKYTLPEGSDKLSKMDPVKLKEVQGTSPSMYSLKTLFDQINRNL